MFNSDKTREAFEFALEWHGTQKYADDHPYILHLYDVVHILYEFDLGLYQTLVCSAWLHDVIEDTPCNYHDIKNKFGEAIAKVVYALTDELGRDRKERKQKTLPKLDKFKDAQIVKLADWIANVRQCHRNKNKMYKMYKRDYEQFSMYKKQSLTGEMDCMWKELDKLLSCDSEDFNVGADSHHREFDLAVNG